MDNLISLFNRNLLKAVYHYKRGDFILTSPPKSFNIEPTNICNYRCSFCPQSNPEHHKLPKGYMSLDQLELIFKKMRKEGAWSRIISFTRDGEPFLNKDFPEFIRLANQYGFKPRFSTNASLFTPEKANLCANYGYFLAAIDFSPDQNIFETYRGYNGQWEVVLQNIKFLVDLANQNPKVYLEIVDISGFVYKEKSQLDASLSKLSSLFNITGNKRIKTRSRNFHNFLGQLDTPTEREEKNYKLCPYPWFHFTIAWNGDVVACCRDTESRYVLGNVLEQGILEIWNGERAQFLRKSLVNKRPQDIEACKLCDLPWSGKDKRRWRVRHIISSLSQR